MLRRQVYLYAFDGLHRVVDHTYLEEATITIQNIQMVASKMLDMSNNVQAVYAIDNRIGLGREFRQAVTSKDFAKHLEFEDTVNYEGMLILRR